MPKPMAGESKKDYIARFMESGEARSDFPDEKQRLAVAYSMFEKRNAGDMYGRPQAEHPWPKKYSCSFIEPGVVFYQDLGECRVCGNERACVAEGAEDPGSGCDPTGATVLVKQEALARMAQSFVGKPVIDKVHEDVTPETVANGEADGIVTRVWLDDKSGWWMCEFLVWDPETQMHCESPAFSVSCAYEPTDVDSSGGEYHNIPFKENILNGEYTHLAIVTNPRYEGARIFVNSKGGSMSWRQWLPGARKNAAPLDPLKTKINVDGEEVSLQNLYDAAKEDKPKEDLPPALNDDTIMEVDGKEHKLGDLKQAYRNRMKKNAEAEACPSCGQKKNGAEKAGEKEPLPDLRRQNDQAEDQAKKLAAEADAKKALELEQSRKNADEAAARDEKDKAEAAAKDLEKKNADDKAAKDKADEELRQADEAAKAKKAADEKRNSGRKSFEDLRNARERAGEAVKATPVSIDERLAKGKTKYGSPA